MCISYVVFKIYGSVVAFGERSSLCVDADVTLNSGERKYAALTVFLEQFVQRMSSVADSVIELALVHGVSGFESGCDYKFVVVGTGNCQLIGGNFHSASFHS